MTAVRMTAEHLKCHAGRRRKVVETEAEHMQSGPDVSKRVHDCFAELASVRLVRPDESRSLWLARQRNRCVKRDASARVEGQAFTGQDKRCWREAVW